MCISQIKLKTGDIVPCGRCPACKARRVSAWSFRLQQEEKNSDNSHFITLTYDTKNLKFSKTGKPTLDRRDFQNFIKSLRRKQPPGFKSVKYYAAGEYGSKTFRPHYHVILFNVELTTIQFAWPHGQIHYGKVTPASIGYSLKYISKRKFNKGDDRKPECQYVSKGMGAAYLTANMKKWHKSHLEKKMYCTLPDGKKIAMPRYYKDKIYSLEERLKIRHHFQNEMDKKEQEFQAMLYSSPDFETILRNKKEGIYAAYDAMYYKSTQNTFI
ncbi:MAG: replication initiator protein [Arizlama microvirus]|nr:MAG: replication initiator protein [Arizlama microvirus]